MLAMEDSVFLLVLHYENKLLSERNPPREMDGIRRIKTQQPEVVRLR